jgi:uncharacterized protein
MVLSFSSFLSPGVRLVENTAGPRNEEIASHITTYMIGSATLGDYETPTQVTSLADFTNQFGSSASENSVRLFFRNNQNGILFFVRAAIAQSFTVGITSVATGAYTITVNGVANTFTAIVSDTEADIRAGLIQAVNTTSGAVCTAIAGTASSEIIVRADSPSPLTVTVGTKLSVATSTPTLPAPADYVHAIENFSDADDALLQGFIICPEAFQRFTQAPDRLVVGNAMQALASSEGYDWVALVDCAEASDTVAELQSDSSQYTTALGHLAYFAPYLIDSENNKVPPSAGIAAIAGLKFAREGFQEPIGGTQYGLKGVKSLAYFFNRQQQDVLNPLGCNLIRNIRNKGIVLYGMRTRSSDSLYTKINTRVIMNVLNGSLRTAFDEYPFSTVNGTGVLLHRIEETAISVCRRLYDADALFGATEADAFAVECNFINNPIGGELENGNVLLQIYAAPAPGLEKLLVATYRVAIGQVEPSLVAGRPQTA